MTARIESRADFSPRVWISTELDGYNNTNHFGAAYFLNARLDVDFIDYQRLRQTNRLVSLQSPKAMSLSLSTLKSRTPTQGARYLPPTYPCVVINAV